MKAKGWRTEAEADAMTEEDVRTTCITELNKLGHGGTVDLQGEPDDALLNLCSQGR